MKFKNLFIEEVPEQSPSYDIDYDQSSDVDEIDVNTENVSQENLAQDIYEKNGLADTSKSIFKIEELINSLPKEMPNETKKATVLQMLSIFGLTIDEVLFDGDTRYKVLNTALNVITSENNSVIDRNNASIEQKKLEIQSLEKDNADRLALIKDTDDVIETESNRIIKLIEFIGGSAE